jgi:hypothetical protein
MSYLEGKWYALYRSKYSIIFSIMETNMAPVAVQTVLLQSGSTTITSEATHHYKWQKTMNIFTIV